MKVTQSCLTLQAHWLYCPWNSPGQNTGVGSLSLLQGIFPTQGLNQSPALQAHSLPTEAQGKPTREAIYLGILKSLWNLSLKRMKGKNKTKQKTPATLWAAQGTKNDYSIKKHIWVLVKSYNPLLLLVMGISYFRHWVFRWLQSQPRFKYVCKCV